MPDHLRPSSPAQSSAEEPEILKVDPLFSFAESDGETTLSMTSSEDGSPTSNIRNVSADIKARRVSRTSISRPEGYSPAKRASSTKISARTSGGWEHLARKSTSYRNSSASSVGSKSSKKSSSKSTGSSGKGNPKDELIAKLNKQVEMLQEKQKKIDTSHLKTTQNLEAKLEDLRAADSILIGQLRNERNDLKDQLDQAKDRIQSIGEDQELVLQKEQASKRALEQQLAEARARIQKLSEQAMDDHFGGSKIDVLRERRRAIEAQIGGSGGSKPENNEAQPQISVTENQNGPTHADMELVIKNLKDELEASKQVIVQQKEQLRLVLGIQENNEKETDANTSGADEGGWKARFLELQKRHLNLECDRAWSELQLRNRITADSLKFNRRLQHWKQQVEDLESKLNTLQMIRDRVRGTQEVAHQHTVAVEDDKPARGWWGRR